MERIKMAMDSFSSEIEDKVQWKKLEIPQERWVEDWTKISAICDNVDSSLARSKPVMHLNGFSPASVVFSNENFTTAFPMKGIHFGDMSKIVIPIRKTRSLTSRAYGRSNSSDISRLVVAPEEGAVGSSDRNTYLFLRSRNSGQTISSLVEISRPAHKHGCSIYLHEQIESEKETASFKGRIKAVYHREGFDRLEAWAEGGYDNYWEPVSRLEDDEIFYSPIERTYSLLGVLSPLFPNQKKTSIAENKQEIPRKMKVLR